MEVLLGKTWDAYGTACLYEDTPPRPNWIYPLTKLQVEQLGQFYASFYELEVVQLRYMYLLSHPIEQLGFGLLARQMNVDDAATANLLAATKPGIASEILHIGPDTPLTQEDTNQALKDPWAVLERYWPGCRAILESHGQQPASENFWPVAPIRLAKCVLDWQPKSCFEVYLRSLGWQPTKASLKIV